KWARGAFAGLNALCVVMLFMPLHHVWPVIATLGFGIATWALVWQMGRRPLPMRHPSYLAFIALTCLALLSAALVIGPLFVVPIVVIGAVSGFVAQPVGYSPAGVVITLNL